MKISTSWGASKTLRKRKRTVLRTKIRWEVLGLQDPDRMAATPSMEDIRSRIISMASQGLEAPSRPLKKETPGRSAADATASTRKRRHNAAQ